MRPFSSTVPHASNNRSVLAIGEDFGDYRILSVIAASRIGKTCRARNRVSGEEFLLHIFPAYSDLEFRQRVTDGMRVLSRFQCPGQMRIASLGDAAPAQFIACGPCEGASLEEHVKRRGGRMPVDEARRVLVAVTKVLIGAHTQGLIHGQLTPAHIFLREDGTVEMFGLGWLSAIQRLLEPILGERPKDAGSAVTLARGLDLHIDQFASFISPEAVTGTGFDSRSDYFSVGVLAYYLVTGDSRPSEGGMIRRRVSGASARWDSFVGKCTHHSPAQRYRAGEDLLAALGTIDRPSGVPGWAWAAGSAILLAGAGAGLLLWPSGVSNSALLPPAVALPATLEFTVDSAPPGAELAVDGVTLGTAPQVIKGRTVGQQVKLTATLGDQRASETVSVTAGMTSVVLSLAPTAVETASRPMPSVDHLVVKLNADTTIEFVRVAKGKLEVVSGRKVLYELELSEDVWFLRTELTQAQYNALGGENRSTLDWRFFPGDEARAKFGSFPANRISFEDAKWVTEKVNGLLREQQLTQYAAGLPTEVEWEYGARAGDEKELLTSPELKKFAVVGAPRPDAVAAKAPNAFGLHGFLGNVGEWCLPSKQFVGTGDSASTMVIRGGSWQSSEAKVQPGRDGRLVVSSGTSQVDHYGLRLVLRLKPAVPPP